MIQTFSGTSFFTSFILKTIPREKNSYYFQTLWPKINFTFNKILSCSSNTKNKDNKFLRVIAMDNTLFVIYCFMSQIPCVYLKFKWKSNMKQRLLEIFSMMLV